MRGAVSIALAYNKVDTFCFYSTRCEASVYLFLQVVFAAILMKGVLSNKAIWLGLFNFWFDFVFKICIVQFLVWVQ